MPIKDIAVIGGGNGSLTMAGDMALAGFKVRMWTAFPEEFEKLYASRTLKLRGRGRTGDAAIDLVTRDLGEAVHGSQVICCPTPAFSQEEVARQLGPDLEDGQVLFLSPGSLGSYLCGTIFKANGWWRDIAIAEPGTLPYLTRKTKPDEVLVSGHAVRLPVG
ncbi:MAG: glycerol-3-phosphate dehydrogenase, partial [Deltaproteobacteria bacterium]|nr:glycerol-3-phosphate dehydrogenase [Deltaproteobacteria bacterium]